MGGVCHFSDVTEGEKEGRLRGRVGRRPTGAGMPRLNSGEELLEEFFHFKKLTSLSWDFRSTILKQALMAVLIRWTTWNERARLCTQFSNGFREVQGDEC